MSLTGFAAKIGGLFRPDEEEDVAKLSPLAGVASAVGQTVGGGALSTAVKAIGETAEAVKAVKTLREQRQAPAPQKPALVPTDLGGVKLHPNYVPDTQLVSRETAGEPFGTVGILTPQEAEAGGAEFEEKVVDEFMGDNWRYKLKEGIEDFFGFSSDVKAVADKYEEARKYQDLYDKAPELQEYTKVIAASDFEIGKMINALDETDDEKQALYAREAINNQQYVTTKTMSRVQELGGATGEENIFKAFGAITGTGKETRKGTVKAGTGKTYGKGSIQNILPFISSYRSKKYDEIIDELAGKKREDLTDIEYSLLVSDGMVNMADSKEDTWWEIGAAGTKSLPYVAEYWPTNVAASKAVAGGKTLLNAVTKGSQFAKGAKLFKKAAVGTRIVDAEKSRKLLQYTLNNLKPSVAKEVVRDVTKNLKWLGTEAPVISAMQVAMNQPSLFAGVASRNKDITYAEVKTPKEIDLYIQKVANDDFWGKYTDAALEDYIENYSEKFGILLDVPIEKFRGQLLTRAFKNSKYKSVNKFIEGFGEFRKKIGAKKALVDVQGATGEFFEEEVGNFMQGLREGKGVTGAWKDVIDPHNVVVTAGVIGLMQAGFSAFGLPGISAKAAKGSAKAIKKKMTEAKVRGELREARAVIDTDVKWMNDVMDATKAKLGMEVDVFDEVRGKVQAGVAQPAIKADIIAESQRAYQEALGPGKIFEGSKKGVQEALSEANLGEIETKDLNLREFRSEAELTQYVEAQGATNLEQALKKDTSQEYDGAVFQNQNREGKDLYYIAETPRTQEAIRKRDTVESEKTLATVKKHMKRLGLQKHVTAGLVEGIENEKSYGSFRKTAEDKGFIAIKKGRVPKTTGYHEMVHAYMGTMMTKKEKRDVISDVMGIYSEEAEAIRQSMPGKSRDQIGEEIIAQQIAKYETERVALPRAKKIFDRILHNIRQLINVMKRKNEIKTVEDFRREIQYRRSPSVLRARQLAKEREEETRVQEKKNPYNFKDDSKLHEVANQIQRSHFVYGELYYSVRSSEEILRPAKEDVVPIEESTAIINGIDITEEQVFAYIKKNKKLLNRELNVLLTKVDREIGDSVLQVVTVSELKFEEAKQSEFDQRIEELDTLDIEAELAKETIERMQFSTPEQELGYKLFSRFAGRKQYAWMFDVDVNELEERIKSVNFFDGALTTGEFDTREQFFNALKQRYQEEQVLKEEAKGKSSMIFQEAKKVAAEFGTTPEALVFTRPSVRRRVAAVERRAGERGAIEQRKVFRERVRVVKELRSDLELEIRSLVPQANMDKYRAIIPHISTNRQYAKLVEKAQVESIMIEKRNLIAEVKKMVAGVKRATKTGRGIDLEFQKDLQRLIDNMDFAKPKEATVGTLESIREFVEKTGKPIPADVRRRLRRLDATPLVEMSVADLERLRSLIGDLIARGQVKLAMDNFNTEAEKDIEIAKAVDSTNPKKILIEDVDLIKSAKAERKSGFHSLLNAPTMAMKLDGTFGHEALEAGTEGWNVEQIKEFMSIKNHIRTLHDDMYTNMMFEIKDVKNDWTEKEFAELSMHKLYREGAFSQVLTLMQYYGYVGAGEDFTLADLDRRMPEITPQMDKTLRIVQSYVTRNADAYAATYEALENKPFDWVEGYIAPTKYTRNQFDERTAASHVNDLSHAVLKNEVGKRKNFDKGSTISRVKGVTLVPRVDLFNIAAEAMRSQLDYIYLQPHFNKVFEVVNSEAYIKKVGKIGYEWWNDYLQGVITDGALINDHRYAGKLRKLRINITKALISFKVSTMTIQVFAIFDALASSRVGVAPRMMWAMATTFLKRLETGEYGLESEALRLRRGGLLEVEEALEEFRDMQRFNKQRATGYSPIRGAKRGLNYLMHQGLRTLQWTDMKTARAVGEAQFKYLRARGVPRDIALNEADFLMTLTQAGNDVSFRPNILTTSQTARTIFILKNFFLNRFNIIYRKYYNLTASGSGVSNKAGAAFSLALFMLISAFENEWRKFVLDLIKQRDNEWVDWALRGFKDGLETEEMKERFLKSITFALPESIPVIGDAIGGAFVYEGRGVGAQNIVLGELNDILQNFNILIKAKSEESAAKAGVRLTAALGAVYGLPGLSQVADIGEGFINSQSDTGIVAALTATEEEKRIRDLKFEVEQEAKEIRKELEPELKQIREEAEVEKKKIRKELREEGVIEGTFLERTGDFLEDIF